MTIVEEGVSSIYAAPGQRGSIADYRPRYGHYIGGEFVEPIKGDYARPQQFFAKDADAQKFWNDAIAATFTKNEVPVPDAFKRAAQQINQLHGV